MWLSIANLVMQKWFEESRLLFTLVKFVVGLFVLTIVFYIAGVIVVGRKRALFSDAFVISLLGTIIEAVCTLFFPLWIGMLLSLLVWLLLIRHYYETGWLGAIAVGILAIIVFVVVVIILAIILGISFWLILIGKEVLLTIAYSATIPLVG